MTDTPLTRPVFVRHAAGLVLELANLGDAIDFLEEWPEKDRDVSHETTTRTLLAVLDGRKPLSAAQSAIEGFARDRGILENPEEVMPWIAAGLKGPASPTA